MVLVDTCVWIDHLRSKHPILRYLLEEKQVLCHPFVLGELALGGLTNRAGVMRMLDRLPHAEMARNAEVLQMISNDLLPGSGIGYVDAHLLASARLTPGASLLTSDRRLLAAASRLTVAFHP